MGLVDARQGFGWFAAVDPLRQSLGRLGTIESQLADSGVRSERRILDFGFVAATPRVRQVLGAATVLEVRGHREDAYERARRLTQGVQRTYAVGTGTVPPMPATSSIGIVFLHFG